MRPSPQEDEEGSDSSIRTRPTVLVAARFTSGGICAFSSAAAVRKPNVTVNCKVVAAAAAVRAAENREVQITSQGGTIGKRRMNERHEEA